MLRGSWVSLAVAAAPIKLARSDGQSGGYSEPEVGLGAVTAPLGILQSEVVVHRLAEFLLAAEIAFRCLHRGVP